MYLSVTPLGNLLVACNVFTLLVTLTRHLCFYIPALTPRVSHSASDQEATVREAQLRPDQSAVVRPPARTAAGHPQQVPRHGRAGAAVPRRPHVRGAPHLLRVLQDVPGRVRRHDRLSQRRALQHQAWRVARLRAVRGELVPHLVPPAAPAVTSPSGVIDWCVTSHTVSREVWRSLTG